MSLVKDNHMVFEEIWVIYALPNEDAISNIPQTGLLSGLIIKPNGISNLLANLTLPLMSHSIGHTNCSDSPRLCYNNINPINSPDRSINIFLNKLLLF